jgi:uncharacterized membrane protein
VWPYSSRVPEKLFPVIVAWQVVYPEEALLLEVFHFLVRKMLLVLSFLKSKVIAK